MALAVAPAGPPPLQRVGADVTRIAGRAEGDVHLLRRHFQNPGRSEASVGGGGTS